MSTQHRDGKLPELGGICTSCEHDLWVRREDGELYCSNQGCVYNRRPHPAGKEINCPDRLLERRK